MTQQHVTPAARICAFDGCFVTKLHAYGMCSKHYTTAPRFKELNRNNQRKYRAEGRDWYKDSIKKMKSQAQYRIEQSAAQKVRRAIRAGKLVREPCEVAVCVEWPHAHHDDYNFPLKVRWLCRSHHKEWHRDHEPIYPATCS